LKDASNFEANEISSFEGGGEDSPKNIPARVWILDRIVNW
jgi:hypothetical protein